MAETRSPADFGTPATPRRRLHPLIIHGASLASGLPPTIPPAQVVIDAPANVAPPELASTVAVAPVIMQRAPGRVLGRATPDPSLSDVTGDEGAASPDATQGTIADAGAVNSGIVRVSVGKKGRSASARASKGSKGSSKSAKFKNPGDGVVHLNSATAEQFEQLPGVGPAMSGRIVEYRAQIGKFTDISQMLDVKGIGEKKYAKMQPFLML